ncbi:MAG: hypothetical protein HZA89_06870, partial [Verrucomicrobia bacterium]|nr:hypothetical protein [Verrucomicrobiota bacterium]
MKLTSSRIVNRVLIGSFVLIALFVALQFVDYLLSRKFEAEEVKHGDERRKYSQALREWIRAEPPDGSFSVLIPQRPVLLTNLIQNPSGQHISIQLGCVDRGGRSTYIAAYTEFPTNADLSNREAIYASAHSHFADKLGELRRERPVTLQDILGRETEVALRDGTN